jgi:hypothetical protein
MSEINFCKLILDCYELELDPEKSELTGIINSFLKEDAPADQTRRVMADWCEKVKQKVDRVTEESVRQKLASLPNTEEVFGTEQ